MFHIHATRRTFISRCARAGVPVQITAKLTGIETLDVVHRHYTDFRDEDMRGALAMLAQIPS